MVSLLCASSICISKNENVIAAAVTTVYTEEEDISFLLFLLILVYTFNID